MCYTPSVETILKNSSRIVKFYPFIAASIPQRVEESLPFVNQEYLVLLRSIIPIFNDN